METGRIKAQTASADIFGLCPETVFLILLCMADAFSTIFFVKTGMAVEANPIMDFFLVRGAFVFLAAKVISFLPFVVVCESFRRRHPLQGRKMIRVAVWGYALLYVGLLAVVNLRGV